MPHDKLLKIRYMYIYLLKGNSYADIHLGRDNSTYSFPDIIHCRWKLHIWKFSSSSRANELMLVSLISVPIPHHEPVIHLCSTYSRATCITKFLVPFVMWFSHGTLETSHNDVLYLQSALLEATNGAYKKETCSYQYKYRHAAWYDGMSLRLLENAGESHGLRLA